MERELYKSKHFVMIILGILFLAIAANCFAANPLMQYTFKFSYDKGLGDSYTGKVYALQSYGYYVGYTKNIIDENGKTGYYKITAQSKSTIPINRGKVFVSSYYNKESNKNYTPLNSTFAAGSNYLSSEHGYIINNLFSKHYFGAGYDEADLISKSYDFKYSYKNGDYFLGNVYAREDHVYKTGYTQSIYSEGVLVGNYKITALKANDTDSLRDGTVYANNYYDFETKLNLKPVGFGKAIGNNYLGSEVDYIIKSNIPEYYFSGNYHEADQVTYRYDFNYTYNGGEYYTGSMYASPGLNYSVGYRQNMLDETGNPGLYEISAQAAGYSYQMNGQVYVSSYYDIESGQKYTPVHNGVTVGNNFLGSESDYILNKTYSNEIVTIAAGIKEFRFGAQTINNQTVNYQADVANIYNVKDFGARADGLTNDSGAIQNTVNQAYANGGGFIIFPSGTYSVITVNIREGITYYGDYATILRPAMQPKWTRTFTNQQYPYSGTVDSKLLEIRGLTFDGNSQSQGPYKKYELEHSDLLYLMGNSNNPGQLKVIIEDCTFKNSVSDGIAAYINTDIEVYNCTFENCFRAGFSLSGGNSIANIKDVTIKGTVDSTSLDIECLQSMGYGGSYKITANVENLTILDGGRFDIGLRGDSVFTGDNIKVEAPLNTATLYPLTNQFFNLYTIDSAKVVISNSQFDIKAGNNIYYPHDVTFNNCTFYATETGISEGSNTLYAAPVVIWNSKYLQPQNQKLTFNDCVFTAKANVDDSDTVYGIYTGIDYVASNNYLIVNGGQFSDKLDVGIKMQNRGGNWIIKDTTIDSGLAFYWVGSNPYGGQEYVNIGIDGVKINGAQFMYAGDYAPAGSNLNKLEIRNVNLNQISNYIISPYGLLSTQYIGNRVIIGENAPTGLTHGFVGDIYTDNISQWRCIKAGYFCDISGANVLSEWIGID